MKVKNKQKTNQQEPQNVDEMVDAIKKRFFKRDFTVNKRNDYTRLTTVMSFWNKDEGNITFDVNEINKNAGCKYVVNVRMSHDNTEETITFEKDNFADILDAINERVFKAFATESNIHDAIMEAFPEYDFKTGWLNGYFLHLKIGDKYFHARAFCRPKGDFKLLTNVSRDYSSGTPHAWNGLNTIDEAISAFEEDVEKFKQEQLQKQNEQKLDKDKNNDSVNKNIEDEKKQLTNNDEKDITNLNYNKKKQCILI